MCEENRVRAGVEWKHAETWMCRTENASYIDDVVRVRVVMGYSYKLCTLTGGWTARPFLDKLEP